MPFQCKFKDRKIPGVEKVVLDRDFLIINDSIEIPLEESQIACGVQGKKTRFDGNIQGYQTVLKSCTYTGNFEGYIFDTRRQVSADVECGPDQE